MPGRLKKNSEKKTENKICTKIQTEGASGLVMDTRLPPFLVPPKDFKAWCEDISYMVFACRPLTKYYINPKTSKKDMSFALNQKRLRLWKLVLEELGASHKREQK